jgi:hypothetical protein
MPLLDSLNYLQIWPLFVRIKNVQEKHFITMTPFLGQRHMDVILGRLQIPSFDPTGVLQLPVRCKQ